MRLYTAASIAPLTDQSQSIIHTEDFSRPQRSLLPSVYTGKECPREFLRFFNLWVQFHEIDDASATSAFGLLMCDHAAIWFRTVNKEQISLFAQTS